MEKRLQDYVCWREFVYTHTLEKQMELVQVQDQDIKSVDLNIRTEFTTFLNDMNVIRPKKYNPRREMKTDRNTYYEQIAGTYALHPSKTFPYTLKQQTLRDLLNDTCIYDWLYEAFAFGDRTAVFRAEEGFFSFTSEDFTAVLGHQCWLFEDVLLVDLRKSGDVLLSKAKAHEIFQRGPAVLLGKSLLFGIFTSFHSFVTAACWAQTSTPYLPFLMTVSFGLFFFYFLWYSYRYVVSLIWTDDGCRAYGGCFCVPILLYAKRDKSRAYTFKESIDYGRSLRFLI